MTTETERPQRTTGLLSPLIDTIVIAALLLSGIGLIFYGKITDQITAQPLFLSIALGIEIAAIIIIAIYVYVRHFRLEI